MGKKRKKGKFFINTEGDNGRRIDEKKTRKPYVKKKVTKETRQTINKAAVAKAGSRKKAKKKGQIVSKGTKFKQLNTRQKKAVGVKGQVNTTKELNALRIATGYKVDRSSDKAGSIKFAIAADRERGNRLQKEYANKKTKGVVSKMTKNAAQLQSSKDALKMIRQGNGKGELNAEMLGFMDSFSELQGQYNKGLEAINNFDPTRGMQGTINDLNKARAADRDAFAGQIDGMNTLINNLQMETDSIVQGYEDKIATDQQQFQDSMGVLRDAYAMQGDQMSRMNQIYAEQAKKAENMKKAYIPTSNQTAGNPLVGDRRKGRKASDRGSSLSSLTISTGLGRNANPLAGLQLA